MTVRLRFLPPDKVLNANDKLHWRAKAERVALWRHAAGWAATQLPTRPLGRCEVRVYFPVRDSRRRDPANWHPTCKPIIDGLVDAGVWPDDTPEFVEVMEPRFYRTGADVVVELVLADAPVVDEFWPNGDEKELGMARVRELREQKARADHPTGGQGA